MILVTNILRGFHVQVTFGCCLPSLLFSIKLCFAASRNFGILKKHSKFLNNPSPFEIRIEYEIIRSDVRKFPILAHPYSRHICPQASVADGPFPIYPPNPSQTGQKREGGALLTKLPSLFLVHGSNVHHSTKPSSLSLPLMIHHSLSLSKRRSDTVFFFLLLWSTPTS